VSLDVQGEVLAALLAHWGLDAPHVVAHDYGGAVALRAYVNGASHAGLTEEQLEPLLPPARRRRTTGVLPGFP